MKNKVKKQARKGTKAGIVPLHTNRTQAEEALQESEKKFRSLFEQAGDYILLLKVTKDKGLVVADVNQMACKIHGYTREEFLGMPIIDLNRGLNEEQNQAFVDRVMSGESILFETEHVKKDGTIFPVEVSAKLLDIGEGSSLIISIERDITERKKTGKALQRAAEHWQTTFDGIKDVVCLLDNDGKILQCNQTMGRMFEKAHDQIVGRNCCQIVHGSPNHLDGCPLVRMRSSLKREEKELSVGDQWFQVTVDPITGDDGKLTGAVHIISDITERKKAENALQSKSYDLGERVKELYCLYGLSKLVDEHDSLEEIFQGTTELIPLGWQYPDLTCARIVVLGNKYENRDFRQTEWKQTAEITVGNRSVGRVEVFYTEQCPEEDEGPFLKKERNLVNGLAERLGKITEHKLAEKALRESEAKLSSFLSSATEGFILYDSDLKLVMLNETALNIFPSDTKQEDLIGKHILEISPGLEKTGRYDKYLDVLKIGKPFFSDDIVPHPKFGDIHLSLTAFNTGNGLGLAFADVTERKRAEKERENLAKFPSENPNPVLRITKDGQVLYSNKAGKLLLIKWKSKVGEVVPQKWRNVIAQAFASEKGKEEEEEVKDRIFSITIAPVKEAGYANLYAHDITERKQAEKERENLAKFPSENPNPVLRITKDGQVLYSNKAGKRLLAKWKSKVGEVVPQKWRKLIAQAFASGKDKEEEEEIKDRVFSITIAPVKEAGYANLYATDITVRKQAAERLRESRDYLERLTNSMWDAVFSVKMPERVIEWANDSFELIGYESEECIGRTTEFLYPDSSEFLDFGNKLASAIAAGKDILHTEQLLKRKNGEVFPAEITVTAYKEKGGVVSVTSIVRDITERKKAEEEINLFAKTLAEKNKELESIMNITAHDLRTPLVNIKGFGDLLQGNLQHLRSIVNKSELSDNLKNELETIFTEDIYQNLKFIKMGTEMLDSLLKALLRLARLGRAAVGFQKLNMNEMISEIAGSVKYHLDTKNVKLTIKPLPDCYGDKVMVGEVFLNLLGNAVKYLDPSRPGLITLSGSKKKDRIIYCVRDNGFGIDPEPQEHVFDIFYRIRHGEKHVDGEGMGLTIVRRIMDFHDGKVWLESEKGIGSKFYVSFPAAQKPLSKRILEIKKGIVPSGTIPREGSYR